MKRFFKFIIGSILIVSIILGIYKFNNKYTLDIINKNIDWTISHKGIKNAKSFDFDSKGNLYIAFEDSIKIVRENNKEETLIKKNDFDIYDMVTYGDDIILATGNDVIRYNYQKDEVTELIKELPNNGVNKETKLLVKGENLYITIGTNTNSGIVDNSNKSYDIPSFEWVLTGENYGEEKTGAFSQYGKSTKNDEKVKEQAISNGSIICYNLSNGKVNNYATGIRNVEGIDYNSEDEIIGIFGGVEDEGPRALKDDKDYIYKVEDGSWYGWPDFSGGDSVKSPRFSDENNIINPVIKNPPSKTPHGPMYQHINISSLKGLVVDREGEVFKENTIIFADNKENFLYALTDNKVASRIIDLGDKSKVETIRCYKEGIYVLDSKMGYLYQLETKETNTVFSLPITMWGFVIVFFIVITTVITFKENKIRKKL